MSSTLPILRRERPVSVVIPTRDSAHTLSRALQSLVPNCAFIREVFVVLSNSPEAYKRSCQAEQERYAAFYDLHLLDSGDRSNGSIARNLGIQSASAPFIAFLDDDDEWTTDKLEAYLRFVEERQLNGDYVLFSVAIACREDRSFARLRPHAPYRGGAIADYILAADGCAQSSTLFLPSSLAKRVQFDDTLVRHQDYDFCMRLDEAGARFYSIMRPLTYWYQRGSGIAKGATFDYCAGWITANEQRLSRAAYIGYVETELFGAANTSGRLSDYWKFSRAHLSRFEQTRTFGRLGLRACRKVLKKTVFRNSAPSAEELLSAPSGVSRGLLERYGRRIWR